MRRPSQEPRFAPTFAAWLNDNIDDAHPAHHAVRTEYDWAHLTRIHDLMKLIMRTPYKEIHLVTNAIYHNLKVPDKVIEPAALCLLGTIRASLSVVQETYLGEGLFAAICTANKKSETNFERRHEEWKTLLALGVLVVFAPGLIDYLGFATWSVREGSWAEEWCRENMALIKPRPGDNVEHVAAWMVVHGFLSDMGMDWEERGGPESDVEEDTADRLTHDLGGTALEDEVLDLEDEIMEDEVLAKEVMQEERKNLERSLAGTELEAAVRADEELD